MSENHKLADGLLQRIAGLHVSSPQSPDLSRVDPQREQLQTPEQQTSSEPGIRRRRRRRVKPKKEVRDSVQPENSTAPTASINAQITSPAIVAPHRSCLQRLNDELVPAPQQQAQPEKGPDTAGQKRSRKVNAQKDSRAAVDGILGTKAETRTTDFRERPQQLDSSSGVGPVQLRKNKPARSVDRESATIQEVSSQPAKQALPPHNKKPKPDDPTLYLLRRPIPTKAYMSQAQKLPQQTVDAKRLLVILDLNGTIVLRKPVRDIRFQQRNGLKHFLQYLFSNHHVMVWSSARPENVKNMCKTVFTQPQKRELVAIWSRVALRLTREQYNRKVQVYKRLYWVWEDPQIKAINRDVAAEEWNQANTVLIDDSAEKAACEPHNVIQIDTFDGSTPFQNDDALTRVKEYLEVLKYQSDVSAYMRTSPFVAQARSKTEDLPTPLDEEKV